MLRTIAVKRTLVRSLTQNLISISRCSLSSPSSYCAPSSPPLNLSFPSVPSFSSPYSRSSKQKNEDANDSLINRDITKPPRLFVVQPRIRPDSLLQAKLDEALNLANSLEEQRDGYFDTELCDKELPHHVVVQNPRLSSAKARADRYFGQGTVETVRCHLNAVESKGEVDAVFVNTVLSAVQQRNLERAWSKPVLDRVGLIIEIFNAHANTKEGMLQAELAALMYKKSRLVRVRGDDGRYTFGGSGEAEVVSARGRGSGGQGFISGAGETELQLQRRRINERRKHLLVQIKEVRQTRALQRASRKRHGGTGRGLATVAVVGYTNAGKSTLVSALSDTYLFSDDRLFATVDPRLRSAVLPSGQKVLISDTVGFISDLPVQLVEAFSATLEEVVEADLLVHVLDSSAPNIEDHRSSVLQVLGQIGVSEEKLNNMIEVWNKIDLQEEGMGAADEYQDDGDNDEEGSFSCEDDDAESDEDNDNKLSAGIDETVDDQLSDYSDGWLQENDEDIEWKILDHQTESSKTWKPANSQALAQSLSSPHVRTSAVTGVGLQELLELIDDKLKPQQQEVSKNVFDRKWRPPRIEEGIFGDHKEVRKPEENTSSLVLERHANTMLSKPC